MNRAVLTRPARRPLAAIHRWSALALALPLLALLATGGLLLFKDELFAASTARSADGADRGLAMLLADPQVQRSAVVLVADGRRPFHTIEWADGAVTHVDAATAQPFPPTTGLEIEQWLYRLHTTLLLGEAGDLLIRWLAIPLVLLIGLGFFLWWPLRAGWRWRDLLPGHGRGRMLRAHLALGALLCVPALLQTGAGALLAHNPSVRSWLRPLATAAPPTAAPGAFTQGDAAHALAVLRATFPDSRVSQASPAGPPGSGLWTLKLRLPGEAHPNGRSLLELDLAAGRFGALRDARRGDLPALYDDTLYALHVGSLVPGLRQVWGLLAAGMLVMLIAGVLAFLSRRRRRSA